MYKIIAVMVSLFIFPLAVNAGVYEDHPYSFEIAKHTHKTSELYRISSKAKDTYLGAIKKSAFRIRTNYDLSNDAGWQATGITRIASLGALYSWATDIDIYDTCGVQIGLIDGELATFEAAKFTLYEYSDKGKSHLVGTAYANASFTQFLIISPTSHIPLAELNRNSEDDNWTMSVHYPEKIDDRILRIFSGFVVNYQDSFLVKKDQNN